MNNHLLILPVFIIHRILLAVTPENDIIVFLCPNGHKLNAPRQLQGHPGQCPHCGVKFRVPLVKSDPIHPSAQNEAEKIDSAIHVESNSNQQILSGGLSSIDYAEDNIVSGGSNVLSSSSATHQTGQGLASLATTPSGRTSRLYQEFLILWNTKSTRSVIELHLPDGEIFSPQLFSRSRSTSEYGYFARESEPGKPIVHIIPWVSICRIVVSGLTNLPVDLKASE